MTREDILKKVEDSRDTIRKFGVRHLGIFGSSARGEQLGDSDIDFLVEFDRASFDNYFDLKFFLEDLLGRKVGLVIRDTIKPRIRAAILEEAVYVQGL
ncbi:MAG: nucleotidyltransferase family protein [Desulfomonile sp.]|nr:nucleotidyltransferase family protein [Desulfomonile sp.]